MTVEQLRPRTDETLAWGHRYAMVPPTHFRVDYAINPFMDPSQQPDAARADQQWEVLAYTLRALGARVDLLPARSDSPDMTFAMNLGLVVGDRVLMSHMRFAERRLEGETAAPALDGLGFEPVWTGRGGIGGFFESGDAFPWRGDLVVGFGKRSDEVGLKNVAAELGVRVHGLRIVHPSMYHLDLAFCPLDERRALVCLDAFDEASAARVLELVPEPIVLSVDEAMTFAANSVVVGRHVVMPACPEPLRTRLADAGFCVHLVDVSELHRGGGSIRCLTNPLDITPGRDLERVPGGELRLP